LIFSSSLQIPLVLILFAELQKILTIIKKRNLELILSIDGTGITIRETGTPGIAARFEMTVPEGT